MKIVSFAIPCYNSEGYMSKCIESLLPGGEDVEIIIVDDGSSDRTAEIADAYAEKYPTIIKAIHQEKRWTRLRSQYRTCQCQRYLF